MTEVYDRIYISNGEEACNVELLRANDIKALVCMALEFKSRHDAIRRESPVIYTAWQGMHDEYPGGTRNTDQQILDAVEAFRTLYENVGCNVLSHCKAGHNRSVAVVVGYLVSTARFRTVQEAYDHIAAQRECRLQPLLKEHLQQLFEKP